MTIPGFTAEAALCASSYRGQGIASRRRGHSAGSLGLALYIDPTRAAADVDCKTFPDSITCNECNATGPGTFNCCQLAKKGQDCKIANPPSRASLSQTYNYSRLLSRAL